MKMIEKKKEFEFEIREVDIVNKKLSGYGVVFTPGNYYQSIQGEKVYIIGEFLPRSYAPLCGVPQHYFPLDIDVDADIWFIAQVAGHDSLSILAFSKARSRELHNFKKITKEEFEKGVI